jgi:predicted transposase YbfD/YdcC
MTPARFGAVTGAHWGIANRLHWRLDVSMNEDQARNRSGNGPENLAVLCGGAGRLDRFRGRIS